MDEERELDRARSIYTEIYRKIQTERHSNTDKDIHTVQIYSQTEICKNRQKEIQPDRDTTSQRYVETFIQEEN